MADVALRLREAVRAAAPGVVDVRVGRRGVSASVVVEPASEQAAAQAAIDAFDWSQAAHDAWEDTQRPERTTLRQAASQAVSDNNAFLADSNVTNAELLAQVRRLTQQMNAVIRRLVQLD
jgi:hypothetical protein